MLLTDSNHVTSAMLNDLDPSLASATKATATPTAPGVSVDTSIGVAWGDVKQAMMGKLTALFQNDIYSMSTTFSTILNGYRVHPSQIFISQDISDPAINWISFQALFVFFRACANRSPTDLFTSKRDQYQEEAIAARRDAFAVPASIVTNPLSAPAAVHIPNSGIWTASAVSGGTSVVGGSSIVTITYVNSLASQNNESGPADVKTVALIAGQRVLIDTSGLVAPDGSFGGPYKIGMAATHWNAYADFGGIKRRLNSSLIPVATTNYVFDPVTAVGGAILGSGQFPDRTERFITRW